MTKRGRYNDAGTQDVQPSRFWAKVRHTAGRVPFMEEVVAGYFAMRDPATPARHKMVLAGAIAYFVLPLDALPDFLVPIGYADDAAAIAAAMAVTAASIMPVHRAQAARVLGKVVPGQTADAGEPAGGPTYGQWGQTIPGETVR